MRSERLVGGAWWRLVTPVLLFVFGALMVGGGIAALADHGDTGATMSVLYGGLLCVVSCSIMRTRCYRAAFEDGRLVLRRGLGRVVIRPADIRSLDFQRGEEGDSPEFVLHLHDGRDMLVPAQRSTERVLLAVRRAAPGIVVSDALRADRRYFRPR